MEEPRVVVEMDMMTGFRQPPPAAINHLLHKFKRRALLITKPYHSQPTAGGREDQGLAFENKVWINIKRHGIIICD
jgi:hypothetical protein